MFTKRSSDQYQTPLPGIRMKTLCHGDRTLMTEFVLDSDSDLSVHSHPYEQTGYLVRGRIILTIGEETYEAMPGDSWCIPSNVKHGARIVEDSVAIEIFSPVREDYLPQTERNE